MNLNEKWFYLKNHETHGPLSLSEIHELIQRGDLRATDPVFHDILGQWTSAGKVAALQNFFGAAPAAVPPVHRSASFQPTSSAPGSPFVNAPSCGPGNVSPRKGFDIPSPPPAASGTASSVTTAVSQASVTPQTVLPASDSRSHEKPLSSDEEQGALFDVNQEENSESGLGGIANQVASVADASESHGTFDYLPALFRGSFPDQFVDKFVRFFYDLGNWSLVLGILLLIFQIILETIQAKHFDIILNGAFCCILALYAALRYVNRKLRTPIIRLNRLGEGYISSCAIPDALSVLFFILGICGLVCFFSLGMAEKIPVSMSILFGFEIFIVLSFAAVIAAKPDSMKIYVDVNLSPSEDLTGIIQYLMKLGMRLCCGGYGIICLSCCILIVFIQSGMFFEASPQFQYLYYQYCLRYSIELLCCAAIPLVSYLFFLFLSCFLDVAKKVNQTTRRG